MSERIVRNSAQCRVCQDNIESKSVHDFVSCKCGAIAVDGGREYIHWVGDLDMFIDTSYIVYEAEPETGPACPTCGCRNVQRPTCLKCLRHLN